jgi:sterol desaturase/sphingolipid hydroxylase (fatty acid hydroxylase superfamily)
MTATFFHWYAAHAAALLVGAFLVAIAIEKLGAWRTGRDLEVQSSVASLTSIAAFVVAKAIVGKAAFVAVGLWLYSEHRLFDLDMTDWRVWLVVFLADDFLYYWIHRCEHRVRVLWASHMVHHSPESIGAMTAVRVPWMEAVYKPWLSLWLPLIGFDPLCAIALDAFSATVAVFQHRARSTRRSVLDGVFVTAAVHRVHHGSNPEYVDKNFGAVLVVWDRLFGTYEPEVAPVVFGIGSTKLTTAGEVLRGGFPDIAEAMRSDASVLDKARYLVAPPDEPLRTAA